ncbi:Major antigenic peptide PEB2 [Campylobacter insulaenigrae]|nr:Major antigenic peptide PEB2 [Campylobacter insulaenigrae]
MVPTTKGLKNSNVTKFIEFVKSKDMQKIWREEGWIKR